jgi:hypothetical protein
VAWDLDREALETANEIGMRLLRVATPGTDPAFVAGLVDLLEERIGDRRPEALSPLGPWPGVCAAGCCPNLRRDRPAVAGMDPWTPAAADEAGRHAPGPADSATPTGSHVERDARLGAGAPVAPSAGAGAPVAPSAGGGVPVAPDAPHDASDGRTP